MFLWLYLDPHNTRLRFRKDPAFCSTQPKNMDLNHKICLLFEHGLTEFTKVLLLPEPNLQWPLDVNPCTLFAHNPPYTTKHLTQLRKNTETIKLCRQYSHSHTFPVTHKHTTCKPSTRLHLSWLYVTEMLRIAECQMDFSLNPEPSTVPRRSGGSGKQVIFNL